jgi:hypothetical protein
MTQLSYPIDLTNAFAGMLADMSPNNDAKSYTSEEATSFPHGTAVVPGTDPDRQMLLPTGAAPLLGVVIHSHAEEVGGDDQNLVDQSRTKSVLGAGRIYVQLESSSPSVVAGTTGVFVRTANPAASPADEGLGRFRGDADGGDALAASNMKWVTSGGPGDLVVLEIGAGSALS